MNMGERAPAAPRCAALVGPYLSGKTTLLESLLYATGAISRKGSVKEGNTVGDSAPEARARKMTRRSQRRPARVSRRAMDVPRLPGLDRTDAGGAERAAWSPTPPSWCASPKSSKALTLAPLFKFLDDRQDSAHAVHQQDGQRRPPRARRAGGAAERVEPPAGAAPGADPRDREVGRRNGVPAMSIWSASAPTIQARQRLRPDPDSRARSPSASRKRGASCSKSLADFDDHLLEQLLEDTVPSKDEIYQQLAKDLAGDLIVPVLLGAARARPRRAPPAEGAAPRRAGAGRDGEAHRRQAGAGDTAAAGLQDLSPGRIPASSRLARMWGGAAAGRRDASAVIAIAGVYRMKGHELGKLASAPAARWSGSAAWMQSRPARFSRPPARPGGDVALADAPVAAVLARASTSRTAPTR